VTSEVRQARKRVGALTAPTLQYPPVHGDMVFCDAGTDEAAPSAWPITAR
jgi:hypothetical protein